MRTRLARGQPPVNPRSTLTLRARARPDRVNPGLTAPPRRPPALLHRALDLTHHLDLAVVDGRNPQ